MRKLNCLVALCLGLLMFNAPCFTQQITLLNKEFTLPAHPRLLLLKGEEKEVRLILQHDVYWNKVHETILAGCDEILNTKFVERKLIGRRLLDQSRECLRRVFYLSYAYRLTHIDKYLKRAESEMLAAAAFTDWNPSHFLDVGEMTMALAIGYDWLYEDLPQSSRLVIKEAILKKGIEPSLNEKNNSWLSAANNWNQVCNAGMAYGALATYEDLPELSRKIIERAVNTVGLAMEQYAPDGAYPEGYSYWGYGTTFNVMFISALQNAFGDDFGLSKKPGFLQTATYLEHMTGPSIKHFNYADCNMNLDFNPAMIWFAGKQPGSSLLWVERQKLMNGVSANDRLLPAAIIWGKRTELAKSPAPKSLMWVGSGINPVALFRTSWTDPAAIFVGFKGGSPSSNHAHMDVGSFVMEAGGVRWSMDLGMQEYESLESKGINLWGMDQNSARWQVLRYNNLAHNTIAIDGGYQLVSGKAPLISHSTNTMFMNSVADLTALYKNKVSKLLRGVAIVNKSYVIVRDEIETGKDSITFRWSMVTPAIVKLTGPDAARLAKEDKTLLLQAEGAPGIAVRTWSTEPVTDYDAPNPGTVIVGYEVRLAPNSRYTLTVSLVPQNGGKKTSKQITPLSKW